MATTTLLLGAAVLAHGLPSRFSDEVIAQRAETALLASTIFDSAAMPLHWEYNTALIAQKVGSGNPEFYSPPLNLWYKGVLGGNTPYGQQALSYLKVGGSGTGFTPSAVQDAVWELYNPSVCPGPNGGWYLDASTKEFVQNYQSGARFPHSGGNDNQADAATHAIIVTSLLGGNTTFLLDTLEPVIRVTQDTSDAAAFGSAAARLFEKVLVYNYSSPLEAVLDTIADLRNPSRHHPYMEDDALATMLEKAATAASSTPPPSSLDFIKSTGQSCDYAFTLPNVAFLASTTAVGLDGFLAGARENILAGGDSGSRGCFLGAIAGARLQDKTLLPADWAQKTTILPTVRTLAAALVAQRSSSSGSSSSGSELLL